MSKRFDIGRRVKLAHRTRPYRLAPSDPQFRRLWIYTHDPTQSRFAGGQAQVDVAYERLTPGPTGSVFAVCCPSGETMSPLDLDQPHVLMTGGTRPSAASPAFRQQMVYAVCVRTYQAFRSALGRDITWGFGKWQDRGSLRLRLYPNGRRKGERGHSAYWDREEGAIVFPPMKRNIVGASMPAGGLVYPALSHDVIVHELTHAVIDGLRWGQPAAHSDMSGWHEGVCDIAAIFQKFTYESVVARAIRDSGGTLASTELLKYATEVLESGGDAHSRHPVCELEEESGRLVCGPGRVYTADLSAHEKGVVLRDAIFEAFAEVFVRKTEVLLEVAGVSAHERGQRGVVSKPLASMLARKASKLARQFFELCVRAIDYCPPSYVTPGDYLRALITADAELVPDDPWGYREALVDAFRRHGIYPMGVSSLSPESVRWPRYRAEGPSSETEVPGLSFNELRFDLDPGRIHSPEELEKQANALGQFVTDGDRAGAFGLRMGADAGIPVIESVRSLRRVGPDGQVLFDQVAEISQERPGSSTTGVGGATVIIGPDGVVRYVIASPGQEYSDRVPQLPHSPRTHERSRDIFGDYDLKPVADSSQPPWNCICALAVVTPDGSELRGTGWLASPQIVITAAHNLFHKHLLGGWASRVDVLVPNGSGTGFSNRRAKHFDTITQWQSEHDPGLDLGFIALERSAEVPGLTWYVANDETLQTSKCTVAGYPSTRDSPVLMCHQNSLNAVTTRRLFYRIDTDEGMSGAPVIIGDSVTHGSSVVAVHGYGTSADSTELVGQPTNSALRVSGSISSILQAWAG